MKRRLFALAAVAAVGAVGVGALQAATPNAQVPVNATKTQPVLRERTAEKLAKAAMQACAAQGFAVTAAVVDRDGVPLALLRDEDATGATFDSALGKARASAGFKSPSGAPRRGLEDQSGAADRAELRDPGRRRADHRPGGQPARRDRRRRRPERGHRRRLRDGGVRLLATPGRAGGAPPAR